MPPWDKYQTQGGGGPWEKYSTKAVQSDSAPAVPGGGVASNDEPRSGIGKVVDAVKEGFGDQPIGLSPASQAALGSGALGFVNRAVVSPLAAAADAGLRGVDATWQGAGAAISQIPGLGPQFQRDWNQMPLAFPAGNMYPVPGSLLTTAGRAKQAARVGAEAIGSPAIAEMAKSAGNKMAGVTLDFLDRVGPNPENAAARRMLSAANREGLSPTQVEARVAELGPQATLADALPALGESLVNAPNQARTAALDFLPTRQEGQGKRIISALEENLTPGNYSQGIDELSKARSAAAGPKYAEAFDPLDLKPIKSPLIERLMERPVFQQGLRKGITDALDEAAITGQDARVYNTWLEGADLNDPNIVIKKAPTLRILDAAKRGLDSIIAGGGDEIRNPLNGRLTQRGMRIEQMRKALVDELDKNAPPAYKQAREAWAGPSRAMEMMNDGLDFIKSGRSSLDIEQIKKLPEVDKQFMRIGAKQALNDMVANNPDGANSVRKLFGNQMMRDKLEAIFPDKESFQRFAKTMQNEGAMFDNTQNMLRNSRTSYREALREDAAPGGVMETGFNLLSGNLTGAARGAARGIANRMFGPSEATANQLAGMFSPDRATQARLLELMRQREASGMMFGPTPRPSGGLLGNAQRRPSLLSIR